MKDAFGRTLRMVILTSFAISLAGVFIDLDHWYALQVGWDARWSHHFVHENRLVLELLAFIWGACVYALSMGWLDIEI